MNYGHLLANNLFDAKRTGTPTVVTGINTDTVDMQKVIKSKGASEAEKRQAIVELLLLRYSDVGTNLVDYTEGIQTLFVENWGEVEKLCTKIIGSRVTAKSETFLPDIPTVKELLEVSPPVFIENFKTQAKLRVNNILNWGIEPNTLEKSWADGTLGVFEYLNKSVAMLVTNAVNKQGEKTTSRVFVTRNLALIDRMKMANMLSNPNEWTGLEILANPAVVPYNTLEEAKKFSDGVYTATESEMVFGTHECRVFNLTFEKMLAGVPKFKVTRRQSTVSLIDSVDSYLIPVSALLATTAFVQLFSNKGLMELTKNTDIGEVTAKVTSNTDFLQDLYPAQTDNHFYFKCAERKGLLGYDPCTLRIRMIRFDGDNPSIFYVYPDAIKSFKMLALKTSDNVTAFTKAYPVAAQTLKPFTDLTVNTSEVVDSYLLRMVYNTKVFAMRKAQFTLFNSYIDLSSCVLRKEMRDASIAWAQEVTTDALYAMMSDSRLAEIFGNVDEAMETRKRCLPSYLKKFKDVPFENLAPTVLVQNLKNLLREGVVRFVMYSKKRGIYTECGTYNSAVLARTYGRNYIAEWETPSVRLEMLKQTLLNAKKLAKPDIIALVSSLGLVESITQVDSMEDTVADAEKVLADLAARKQNRVYNPNTLTYKIADGMQLEMTKDGFSYYRTIDVTNILAIGYAPAVVKNVALSNVI